MKKIILIALFFLSVFLNPVTVLADEPEVQSAIGKVLEIIDYGPQHSSDLLLKTQSVLIRITSGEFCGQEINIENNLSGNPLYDINLNPNDNVILHIEKDGNNYKPYISDKHRNGILYFLLALFSLSILIIGRTKGAYSLFSIIIVIGLLAFLFIPLITAGVNIIFTTVLVSVLASFTTLFIVGGKNLKSLSASLATVISLIIAGSLAFFTIKVAHLNGISSEEALILYNSHPNINFEGLLASSILIGALGALMDVAMSISSAIFEFKAINNDMTFMELFNSGMNVGMDIIGTMANTLILAYIGASLPTLFLAINIDMLKFFNLNSIVSEISSALIGSIAVVICVPIVACLSASFLITQKYKK